MGSFNCIGFHSRLPITGGDEIVLILGLHQTAKRTVKYAFDPMVFAPDTTLTPIALPVYCKYDDCRHVCDVVRDKNVETIEKFFGESFIDIIRNCDTVANLNPKQDLRELDVQVINVAHSLLEIVSFLRSCGRNDENVRYWIDNDNLIRMNYLEY